MNTRQVTAQGRLRASTTQRGASRAPQPVARQIRLPSINWLLVRRVAVALGSVCLLGVALEGWQRMAPALNQPIARISVEGDLNAANRAALQERLDAFGEAGFVTANIAGMQQALEQLPWVDQARISRIWPDQLHVEVSEQQPIARWRDGEWLNSRGQVFQTARAPDNGAVLPLLTGPEGSEGKVMQQYLVLTQALRPLGQKLLRLEMRSRGSWFLTTESGLELLLGRDEIGEKMRRFASLYERELKPEAGRIARIDLRYANGLAVAWRAEETAAAAP